MCHLLSHSHGDRIPFEKEQISADTFLERINRVKLITLTDKAHKVIVHKVTKKIDEEVKQSLSAIGIKTIKAMYWRK